MTARIFIIFILTLQGREPPGGLQLGEAPFRGLPAGIATATFQCLQHAEQQRQNLGLDAADPVSRKSRGLSRGVGLTVFFGLKIAELFEETEGKSEELSEGLCFFFSKL